MDLMCSITKGFKIPPEMCTTIWEYDYDNKMTVVSSERIREELYKCFKYDTLKTFDKLDQFFKLKNYIFTKVFADGNKLWLKPTFEL